MAKKKKKDDDIIEQLLKKAEDAKNTGIQLSKIAAEQAQIRGKKLKAGGSKKLSESISAAKRFGSSGEVELKMLEKLGKLKKAGIITEKEFQDKKKEILKRI